MIRASIRSRRAPKVISALSIVALVASLLVVTPGAASAAAPAVIERVSVATSGAQANHDAQTFGPSLSADGRFVVFYSHAANLVPSDTNGNTDVFVRDRQTGETSRVSVSTAGMQGNSFSNSPSISGDGRYVAFFSGASNLVDVDSNGRSDVFVHDRNTGTTTLVSVTGGGAQGNQDSYQPVISADGSTVAFVSSASNLVIGDSNVESDVFVKDLTTSTVTRVSVASDGSQSNGYASLGDISGNGRLVTFSSPASNLVPGDTNGQHDIFLHDRQTSSTERISLSSGGAQGSRYSEGPSMSSDGRFVAFTSLAPDLVAGDSNNNRDVFLRDRATGTTTLVSRSSAGIQGDRESAGSSISKDGRFISFGSASTNLVADDTNNPEASDPGDAFLHDTGTGLTTRVSLSTTGAQGNDHSSPGPLSADGSVVVFSSRATNMVDDDTNGRWDVFVRTITPTDQDGDGVEAATDNCASEWNEQQADTDTDGDGDRCDSDDDNDGLSDAREERAGSDPLDVDTDDDALQDASDNCPMVPNPAQENSDGDGHGDACDSSSVRTTRVSVSSTGTQGNSMSEGYSALSADGRYAVFSTHASTLVNDVPGQSVFLHDRDTASTSKLNLPGGGGLSLRPDISADGGTVAFISGSPNLVEGDTNGEYDVFVLDRATNGMTRVSVSSAEEEANQDSFDHPSVSADGRFVAFGSSASNLVPDDANGSASDVFVRDRQEGTTTRVSVPSSGSELTGSGGSGPSISNDGRYVAFSSSAPDLVEGDAGNDSDVFVHDRQTGTTELVSVSSEGAHMGGAWPSISGNGRYVSFGSGSFDSGWSLYVRDRQSSVTTLATVSRSGDSAKTDRPTTSISENGRYVAFASSGSNLVLDDTNGTRDIFVRDLIENRTLRVNVSSAGKQANGESEAPSISDDGLSVIYTSKATNLVSEDTNRRADTFVSTWDADDGDGDGAPDGADNCPNDSDASQLNTDEDSQGDVCDSDDDGDGLNDDVERGLGTDTKLADSDADSISDLTETNDGEQVDTDGDGTIDALDTDSDDDGSPDATEGTGDSDGDDIPNYRDADDADGPDADADGDGVDNGVDNCDADPNGGQADFDGDGTGDPCDSDTDGDGVNNKPDNCPMVKNNQADKDRDGIGDACDKLAARLVPARKRFKGVTGRASFSARTNTARTFKVVLKKLKFSKGTKLRVYVLEKQSNFKPVLNKPVTVRRDGTARLVQKKKVNRSIGAGDRVVVSRGRDSTVAASKPHLNDAISLGTLTPPSGVASPGRCPPKGEST